jgi:hypothetical protein
VYSELLTRHHLRPPLALAGPVLEAYRHLAVRVVDQALRDLDNLSESADDRESARAFLAGSPMLYYWCELAGLEPQCVIARARTLMSANGRRPRWRC